MGSLWKYFELFDAFGRERDERNDPTFNQSVDVKCDQYPNYAVIPDYNYKPEIIAGFHLIIGGSYGLLTGIFFGLPYIHWKYKRRLGYRDWKLMEKMCMPLFKSTVFCTLAGIGVGTLLELRRIANEDIQKDYNKKVF